MAKNWPAKCRRPDGEVSQNGWKWPGKGKRVCDTTICLETGSHIFWWIRAGKGSSTQRHHQQKIFEFMRGFWSQSGLAHRNRSDFCDLRLRCPSRTPEIARFPRPETAMMHCDLRVQWKVASDLRFRAAISEPKSSSCCGISGDLAPSTRKSLAIPIVRFWCAKQSGLEFGVVFYWFVSPDILRPATCNLSPTTGKMAIYRRFASKCPFPLCRVRKITCRRKWKVGLTN